MKRPSENAAELIAALMHGPKSVPALIDYTGMNGQGVRRWLNAYRTSGVVRCCGEEHAVIDEQGRKPVGLRPLLFELQQAPFALGEYVRPPVEIRERRSVRGRPRKTHYDVPAPNRLASEALEQRDQGRAETPADPQVQREWHHI